MIKFQYNKDKALEAVLWFLNKHGGCINKLKLVKLLFFAEQRHLFNYGRPIIGGNWHALPWGPVPSEFLNDLNDQSLFVEKDHKISLSSGARSDFDEECFSESDLEVLEQINADYGRKDPFTLSDGTHNLRAYKKNEPDNISKNKIITYEDIFLDASDQSMLEVIKESQEAFAPFE